MTKLNSGYSFPEKIENDNASIYDFSFDFENNQFISWSTHFATFEIDNKL